MRYATHVKKTLALPIKGSAAATERPSRRRFRSAVWDDTGHKIAKRERPDRVADNYAATPTPSSRSPTSTPNGIAGNPVSSEHVQDHLIDLHGLHVSQAIHTLKVELAAMSNAARAAGERVHAMVCVGTGHQTKGSRTARLPVAVERFLLDEGLHYTQPQPGLLRVALY